MKASDCTQGTGQAEITAMHVYSPDVASTHTGGQAGEAEADRRRERFWTEDSIKQCVHLEKLFCVHIQNLTFHWSLAAINELSIIKIAAAIYCSAALGRVFTMVLSQSS